MWRGVMNWPIQEGWCCEICGTRPYGYGLGHITHGLTWGFSYGQCRCDACHTVYWMRDKDGPVTTPIMGFKDHYVPVLRAGWQEFATPIDEWDEAQTKKAEQLAEKETT